MKTDDSFVRVAGILAIIMGILYLAVGVNYLFMPEAQKEYLRPEFWPSRHKAGRWGDLQVSTLDDDTGNAWLRGSCR
jgi:hypothetical protein